VQHTPLETGSDKPMIMRSIICHQGTQRDQASQGAQPLRCRAHLSNACREEEETGGKRGGGGEEKREGELWGILSRKMRHLWGGHQMNNLGETIRQVLVPTQNKKTGATKKEGETATQATEGKATKHSAGKTVSVLNTRPETRRRRQGMGIAMGSRRRGGETQKQSTGQDNGGKFKTPGISGNQRRDNKN